MQNQQEFLLEINDDLIKEIQQGNVYLKEGEQQDEFPCVLVCKEQTYGLSQLKYSNSLLTCQNQNQREMPVQNIFDSVLVLEKIHKQEQNQYELKDEKQQQLFLKEYLKLIDFMKKSGITNAMKIQSVFFEQNQLKINKEFFLSIYQLQENTYYLNYQKMLILITKQLFTQNFYYVELFALAKESFIEISEGLLNPQEIEQNFETNFMQAFFQIGILVDENISQESKQYLAENVKCIYQDNYSELNYLDKLKAIFNYKKFLYKEEIDFTFQSSFLNQEQYEKFVRINFLKVVLEVDQKYQQDFNKIFQKIKATQKGTSDKYQIQIYKIKQVSF